MKSAYMTTIQIIPRQTSQEIESEPGMSVGILAVVFIAEIIPIFGGFQVLAIIVEERGRERDGL